MVRVSLGRLTAVLSLCALFLALSIIPGDASHFRGGYIFWERDLTFVGAPGQVKLRVTFEVYGRWTYPDWQPASSAGFVNPWGGGNPTVNCAGVVTTSVDMNTNSCPPVGSLINFPGAAGNGTNFGTTTFDYSGLAFNKPLIIAGRHGVTFPAAQQLVYTSAPAWLDMQVVVTQVIPQQDVMYARGVYDIIINQTSATPANPLMMSFANTNRIVSLLNNNGNTPWRLALPINLNDGNTKSPKSTMFPMVQVYTGEENVITLPTSSFDNLTNRFRLATTLESKLNTPAPPGFALDPLTGVVRFTPAASGFYGVQFFIESVDTGGNVRNSVPQEVIFNAVPCDLGCTADVAVTTPQTTYTTDIDHPISIPITTTVTGPTSGTTSLNHSPLPTDTNIVNLSASGTTLTSTLNWAPTVNSTSNSVCFTGFWTHPSGTLGAQSSQHCVTLTPAPLATALTMPAALEAKAGDKLTINATLKRARDSVALPNRTIEFTWADAPTTILGAATTNASGMASFELLLTDVTGAQGRQLTATFKAIANEFLASSAAQGTVVVKGNTTIVDVPTVTAPSIGYVTPISTVLRAVGTTGVWPAPNQTGVTFTITGPGGFSQVIPGTTTNALGVSMLSQSFVPAGAGPYTVTASFPGNANLFGASAGGPAMNSLQFSALRRVKLVSTPIAGPVFVGTSTTTNTVPVVFTLYQLPELTVPLSGRTLTIGHGTDASPASNNGTTDAAGQRSANVYWSTTGSKSLSASYTPAAGEANEDGVVAAETETAAVSVSIAQSAITEDNIPNQGQSSANYLASVFLRRSSPIAGPLSNVTVTFTFRTPTNGVAGTRTGITDANGRAVMSSAFVIPASMVGSSTLTITAPATTHTSAPTSFVFPLIVATVPTANIAVQPVSAVATVTTAIVATVTDAGGTILPNLQGLSFNGPQGAFAGNLTADGAGQISVNYTPATIAGSGSYTVTYDGSGSPARTPTSSSSTITVRKANTLTTTLTPNQTTGRVATQVQARLDRNEGSPLAMNGKTVTFTVQLPNGQMTILNGNTDASGVATLIFTPALFGVHTVTPSFAGDTTTFEPSSASAMTINVVDTTAPVVVPTVTGLNDGDWYFDSTLITWSVTDPDSSISNTTGCNALNVTDEGTALTFTCSATSSGGTTTQSVTIKRDATPPLLTTSANISQVATSALGNVVTYADPVATDSVSGIAIAACSPASGSQFGLGSNVVTCTAANGAGLAITKTFTISVTNSAPTANGDSATTDEDTPVTVSVLANDTDVENSPLTPSLVGSPARGSVVLNPNGSFTYTPNANVSGGDSFSYQVNDGVSDSGVATVTVNITSVNDAPTANAQSVTTQEDSAGQAIILTGADIDSEGLEFIVVDQPSKGTLSGSGANLVYTPNANANGADAFTFQVNDGNASSNLATVSVTIDAVNDAPTTADGAVTTDEDAAVSGSLSANDLDGNAVTFAVVENGSKGSVAIDSATGAFTYTPNTNENGTDTFTFKVSDGSLESGTSTVTVTINAVNDAPTAAGGVLLTSEDTEGTGSLSANDLDGNTLTYSIVSQGAQGTVTVNPSTGEYSYMPNPNVNGDDSFSFVVNDGSANSGIATVVVAIAPVNDAPVATSDAATTDEDAPVTGNVLGNDIDIDSPITAVLVTSTANGTVVLEENGAFTYTPNTNFNGTDSFTYTANDGGGPSATAATVTITVNAVNDAPTAAGGVLLTSEDTEGTGSLSANDLDGNTLTYSIVSQGAKGTVTVNPSTGQYSYVPNPNVNGDDTFSFLVNDGSANSGIATVTVGIAPVNDAPVAMADAAATDEDAAVTGNVLGNDVDIDSPITAVLVTSTANGTLALNANGDFTYTPNSNFNGTDSFSYKANDGAADSANVTVTISVTAVNDAPTTANGSASTNEDAAVSGSLSANDIDANALTYTIVTNGTKGSVTVNATTGAFTYTPNANENGSDSFTFRVNDGSADSGVSTVTVSIAAVNDAPTADNQSPSTNEDTALVVTFGANDIDADTLSYSIVAGPAHGTLSGSGSSRTYTPAANYNGPDSFTFRVNDGAANSHIATVTIGVTAVNDAPVANNDAATTNANTAVSGAVLTNDTDIEGTTLTAAVVTAPAHGTVTLNANGTYTFTPALDYSGADSFTYRASDGAANSNIATVSLTIQSVAQVAAQVLTVVTTIDPGLSNDVTKITSGNPKNNCQDAAKLIDKISKSNKYSAAEKATMTASVASLAASIPCTP